MPAKQIVFAIVTFLHDLFTSIWIDGGSSLSLFLTGVLPTRDDLPSLLNCI